MKEKKLCKRCGIEKDLTPEFWMRDKKMKNGFSYRCKECMHEITKEAQHKYAMSHREKTHEYNIRYNQEHKEEIRAKRRSNREKEKIKRRERSPERRKEISAKRHLHRLKMGYLPIHKSAGRLIKKLGIRPKCCTICGYEGKPIAHHPDYSKPYEVIFCCNSCHSLIHLGQIEIDKNTIIKLCESEGNKMITKCITCGASIRRIGRAKYCKECKKIAIRENMKRFKERKKLFNS